MEKFPIHFGRTLLPLSGVKVENSITFNGVIKRITYHHASGNNYKLEIIPFKQTEGQSESNIVFFTGGDEENSLKGDGHTNLIDVNIPVKKGETIGHLATNTGSTTALYYWISYDVETTS